MKDLAQFAGLILAAGESSRMGTDKAMLPWPPPAPGAPDPPRHTLVSSAIVALEPLTKITVVVAGNNAEAIATTVGACGAYLVRNPNSELGQFSSLQIGVRDILDRGCDAAIITPVDCPPLRPSSLELLRNAFIGALDHGLWAVAPENNGKHGHPLFVGRDLIDLFLQAPATGNAREILRAHASRVVYVPVPDSLAKAGLNTPEEYEAQGIETQRRSN
jgi:molybdenum cofactor cytidylyltransferase